MKRVQTWGKLVGLTLASGMVFSLPAVMPQWVPPAQQSTAEAAVKGMNWNFQKDLSGWKFGGKWAYKGIPKVQWDKAFGGSLRLDVDFRPVADKSWSEVKLEYGPAASIPVSLAGCNVLSYDLYFDAKVMTAGGFKTKVYAKDVDDKEVINAAPDIDLSKARDAGNGMKVVTVQVQFQPAAKPIKYLMFSLVGANTDYHGALYVNKVQAKYAKLPDGYVDKKVQAKSQAKVQPASLQVPAQAGLVDPQATKRTAQVYAYLQGIAASPYVLYGHQNELTKKVVKLDVPSDTYALVQDNAAVIGVDGLALTGDELGLTDKEKAAGVTLSEKLAGLVIPVAQKGAIITMSCHMPNFELVANKPKVNGHYDFSTYSPNVTTGRIVQRIMPGGDLNPVYRAYIDMVADFAGRLQAADVPILFRPFHENNGSWFWWGAAYCSASEYKNLYRYTVEYLRDTKGLHNLLYVYSPGGPIENADDYATRYPGDSFIDITGFDTYHHDPVKNDHWLQGFAHDMQAVQDFAAAHHKLATVTETGILAGKGALPRTGNQRPDWFREVLHTISPYKMAYFLTWANFDEGNCDQPYMVTVKRGHEMINNFVDFYNDKNSVFAQQIGDYSKLQVQVQPAVTADGYITAPGALDRLLQPCTLQARVTSSVQKAAFQLQKQDGTCVAELPAAINAQHQATAALTAVELAKLGKAVGRIALVADGQVRDSVPVLYNMPAPAPNPLLVDDFESYYGDNSLLKGAYSTNCGTGCSIGLALSQQKQQGEAGMAYHYSIVPGGYAGVVKSLQGADWSQCQGVAFWLVPDGQGQKLICQINTNGEDFEADLSAYTAGKAPQLVKVPFSAFKGKNGGKLDTHAIQHFALYVNAQGQQAVASTLYFDDIHAYK